jgi:hypothetical protein
MRCPFFYNRKTRMLSLFPDPENHIYLPYAGERRYEAGDMKISSFSSLGSALASLPEVPQAEGIETVLELVDNKLLFQHLPRYHLLFQIGHVGAGREKTLFDRDRIPKKFPSLVSPRWAATLPSRSRRSTYLIIIISGGAFLWAPQRPSGPWQASP